MAEHRTPISFLDSTGKPLPKLPKIIRPGTCAAVFNERGEILLQKRADNGFWSMPGGAVDPGESVEQGALREVWEETGLQVAGACGAAGGGLFRPTQLYDYALPWRRHCAQCESLLRLRTGGGYVAALGREH